MFWLLKVTLKSALLKQFKCNQLPGLECGCITEPGLKLLAFTCACFKGWCLFRNNYFWDNVYESPERLFTVMLKLVTTLFYNLKHKSLRKNDLVLRNVKCYIVNCFTAELKMYWDSKSQCKEIYNVAVGLES